MLFLCFHKSCIHHNPNRKESVKCVKRINFELSRIWSIPPFRKLIELETGKKLEKLESQWGR